MRAWPILFVTITACGHAAAPSAPLSKAMPAPLTAPEPTRAPTPQATKRVAAISRDAFNRRAQEVSLPILWAEDKNGDSQPEPDEIAFLWGVAPDAKKSDFVAEGAFTERFLAASD